MIGLQRGKDFKLKEGGFILGIRKKLFSLRVVRHGHRLLTETVNAPSLKVFKARLELDLVTNVPAHGREVGVR